jgi:hypothetical protein
VSIDNAPIVADMSDADVIAAAKAKLGELALHDLRFHMARYLRASAGGPIEGGMSDHQMTRAGLRQLLDDIASSQPTELE